MAAPPITGIETQAQSLFAAGAQAWEAGRPEMAAQAFAKAALLLPHWAAAHANLGAALRRLNRPEAAIVSYRRALVFGDEASTRSNLGNALRDAGHLAEAEVELRRAVAMVPGNVGYAYNLALLLRDRRSHREAVSLLERVAQVSPDNPEFQWDLALSHLTLGEYQTGFAGYESRLGLARNPPRSFLGPRWDGGDPAGKTLFLTSEQGFGDALQFARYVPLLARLGARIVLECLTELMDLFATLPGVITIVEKGGPPPPYDAWAPMASLPHLMGTTFQSIPANVPYIQAPPRPHLSLTRPPNTKLAVGLVWAGKTTPRDRSWPLTELLPLMEDPRAAFYSFQLGPRAADLAQCGVDGLVRDAAPVLKSFADSAALMSQMDLIITIDTSTAHLAGALGCPVWVLLRYVSDWRWQDEPADSPWYPTMRLFRQTTPLDFKTPVAEMVLALAERLRG
ncbi:TPR repeat-containing protein [Candidatus Terasakiella magnetica]|nr:TPR repeat-containing protein [Candidatus Terasakiella magnetica]